MPFAAHHDFIFISYLVCKETLYETTPAEGALVSSIFLISYSVARFLAGFVPAIMPVKNVFFYGGIVQGGNLGVRFAL